MGAVWHLAQMNVAHARWALDRPEMADFVARVADINRIAESSPGFVWRRTEDAGEPMRLVNLSVWESVEALRNFVYQTPHMAVFRNRDRWFEKSTHPHQALWWIAAGHQPSYAEGHEKLEQLRADGSGTHAFTFASVFPPPSGVLPPDHG